MGMFSEVNESSSKPVGKKGAKLCRFTTQKELENKLIETSPYLLSVPQSDTENNAASRLAHRLWNEFAGTVVYVDVHRRKQDGNWGDTPESCLPLDETLFQKGFEYRYVKSVETGLRPQFTSTLNIKGKKTQKRDGGQNWRVADAIIQRDMSTGKLVKVGDWEIVNGDYVASENCRFEWTNVKAKTGSVMSIGEDGDLKVTTLSERGKVRIDACNGISVCEFMALNEQGLINQTIIQQVQMSASALETSYITYTVNYNQVRQFKDEGTAAVDLWGQLKCGESIAIKQVNGRELPNGEREPGSGRPSLEFKSTVFHKKAGVPVNLDSVQFGYKPMLVSVSTVTGKMTVSDSTIKLV